MTGVSVRVLHNVSRDASLGLNAVWGEQGRTYVAGSHPLVPVFDVPAEAVADLLDRAGGGGAKLVAELLWHAFNVGEDDLARGYRARRLRSLSVGDVLLFGDGIALACQSVGWRPVKPGELNVLGADEAVAVIRERYDMRPGEWLTVTVPLPE